MFLKEELKHASEKYGIQVRDLNQLGQRVRQNFAQKIMNASWKKIKEEPYQAGFRKMIRKTFELPNGEIADYDIKNEKTAVSVLVLTKDNKVLLVKQFRPGPEKFMLELPEGYMNEGESPEQAIARELLEETGYTGIFEYISTSYDCAYSTKRKHNFIATECKKIQDPQNETDEFIEFFETSLEELRKLIQNGKLTHVETAYMGLDYLGLL